ncbi:TonB-dependent receptor [Pontibaca methylaminivorans]|uniref:Catecholate siderophore receptor n=1 Tax=Pontibaca methylaminivorans TaxID=515897 RepID=A0A1R3X2Z1_9RHOB|nr:TonB-dependent siderophore receptor [Pontibaca methylaminivorans]SIT84893.1 catecholate siderophore receptor [Pontibaca methylaminivorans]
MAAIQPQSLRFKLSTVGVSLGVAFGGIATAKAVHAQDNSPEDEPDQPGMTTLDTISITTGAAPANTNEAGTGVSRLPATVFKTPREIQVVPAEIIRQQQAITLEETLRNVPGITLSTGEGRGGSSGDQFRIRGLAAQGDIYRDGLRDFGAFTHDNFNTESVEVFKGPSGDNFGVGNMGGLINQTSKRAHLTDETTVSGMAGTGPLGRIQIDTNRVVGENQALRFNLMAQKQDAAHRDHVESDRLGLAVDWGTGIGTGTEFHIGYSYLRERGKPDMGQPMAEGADGISRPLLEYGVPGYSRRTSYVRSTDRDDTDVHDITATLSHDMGNGWILTNDTRLSRFTRDRSATHPAALTPEQLADLLAGIDVDMSYAAGGGMTYRQKGWGFQNVLALRGEFQTGTVEHDVMVGLDLNYQVDKRRRGTFVPARPGTTPVTNPVYDIGSLAIEYGPQMRSTAFNAGLFVSDRMSFGNGWSIAGAARLDHFENSFDGLLIGATDPISARGSSSKISPSISIIYEPNPDLMGYLSFARTYRPQGTDIAMNVNAFDSEIAGSLKPERADLIELGGKMNLMGGRVGLTGAIFQITKKNSYDVNPDGSIDVGFSDAGQGRRIRGIEIGASGEITDAWSVYANYAYLDGKVRGGPGIEDDNVGNRAPGVPRNNASIWTSYVLPQSGVSIPGEVTLAGGIRYASKYFSNPDNTAQIPETFSLDAMISYEQNDWRLALNAYNLTDHQNYSSTFSSSRAVPDSGRTFVVSVSKRF